ncbi:hypothetical protein AWV77_22450 [Pseudomonas palleroniana]|uniref:Uncharacterized protein n=1 Tax=Pseudomonas palleroniana TaxID=191390 RepID=A0A0X7JYP6_9PSED|nr:hypothetical protein AWV77_22450 [Pseudomonas palleroniana]
MVVFSQVVVGLASVKNEVTPLFCTYNSILDFYVLTVNHTSMLPPPMTFLHNAVVFLSVLL